MSMKLGPTPLITVVTVTFRDAWALMKTARSVFSQTFSEFEYIVVDGDSNDGTANLIEFWQFAGLVDKAIIEPDKGVYDAMNKGVRAAAGEYICFMNAGDVFADSTVLERVAQFLLSHEADGCLGWGELNGQVWASWTEGEAFKLASLGFCHQALYVRRSLLEACPFDARSHKTDSDTLQLGRLYGREATVPIIPEVLAVRGGEPGISANLERTKQSIVDTITSEYGDLDEEAAQRILDFRRNGSNVESMLAFLGEAYSGTARSHLARLVLDTLFQKQSRNLNDCDVKRLHTAAMDALIGEEGQNIAEAEHCRLLASQSRRVATLKMANTQLERAKAEIEKFEQEENMRFAALEQSGQLADQKIHNDVLVALTSFPARIRTVQYVIRSLVLQTCRPKEIHLFLGRDEFPNVNWLPSGLRVFEDHGLVIHLVDKTCHQYDKFLHGSELNRDHDYIIVDDDVIYPPHAIQTIIQGRDRFPGHVIANRCHMIPPPYKSHISPYGGWLREVALDKPSFRLMPTGAGGVLYPKGFFDASFVCDVSQILSTAPYADDLWLKLCAIAQGISTYATALSNGSKWYHRYTPTMRDGTLMDVNVGLGLNDPQMERCCAWLDRNRPSWRMLLQEDAVGEEVALQ